MSYARIAATAARWHLAALGGVQELGGTVILFGPLEPGFWTYFQTQPEAQDGAADPLDRFSRRAMEALAAELGALPFLPSDGPPYPPFISWALNSGQAWQSPVGLLVHGQAGLLVSYRGALRFDRVIDLPKAQPAPCDRCTDQPCRRACPVDALSADGYDVAGCKSYLDAVPDCRGGCQARLACPISRSYPRSAAQTRFHMEAFHPSCHCD